MNDANGKASRRPYAGGPAYPRSWRLQTSAGINPAARKCGVLTLLMILAGCAAISSPQAANPFRDAPPITLDGVERELTANLAALGELEEGRVLRVIARGAAIDAVLILAEDERSDAAGVVAGGGRPNAAFQYRIPQPGRYFVFLLLEGGRDVIEGEATLSVGAGDSGFRPPARQTVQVIFEDGYLSDPGLFDPEDGTDADRQFLEDISPLVREEVIARLRETFAGTPIDILDQDAPAPAGPFSRLRFSPQRVLTGEQGLTDSALPAPDPTRPQCQVRVVFGEVLPEDASYDPGNQVLDDEAVVYVGSFQGRGRECWSAVINSINNVVLSLAQTGAHEIGHLVGLQHVEQIDIMNRTATLAFQRELVMTRGQLQVEVISGDQVITNVFTSVIQDPEFYFRSNFGL